MNLSNNETQFFSTLKFEENDDLKQALIDLNTKMDNITRQVSFWDVYNVTQVLLSDNDLTSKLALLNVGEAAIVNANMLNNGAENHYRGDIAYRQMNGEILWIPAENKGIYKPSFSYENNQLKVTYSFQSAVPDAEEGEPVGDPMWVDMDTQNAYAINETVISNTISFPAITVNSNILKPMIRFYIEINGGDEDFYCDWDWQVSNGRIVITLNSSIDVYSINTNIGALYIRVR